MSKEYYQKNKAKWKGYYSAKKQNKPLYATWHSMLVRTGVRTGAKNYDRANYIDLGIEICDSWLNYREFEAWAIQNGWKPGLQIDRINNNRGYDPSNCRFATPKENTRNRRCTHMITNGDMTIPFVKIWEDYTGDKVPYKVAENRLRRGWDYLSAIKKGSK